MGGIEEIRDEWHGALLDALSSACARRATALAGTSEEGDWDRRSDAAYDADACRVAEVLREHLGSDCDSLCVRHLQGPGSVLDDDGVLDALAVVMDASAEHSL